MKCLYNYSMVSNLVLLFGGCVVCRRLLVHRILDILEQSVQELEVVGLIFER
jgi:hypothetical protein